MKFNLKFTYAVVAVAFLGILSGCNKSPSKEKIAESGELCRRFIGKEMKTGPEYESDLETMISDSWVKDGKLVFEVGYRKPHSDRSSYSIRRCIHDEEKGTLTSPPPMGDSQWDK